MNNTFKKIPTELRGKVFGFTGTLPGVGKTYFMHWYANQLKRDGFKIKMTGTTHKAAGDNNTVTAESFKHYEGRFSPDGKHIRTHAFYIIDEAFMLDKPTLATLKNNYPKCCFLLFGDPLQYKPASGLPQIDKNDFDYIWEFNKPHRFMKDTALIWFLEGVKRGLSQYEWSNTLEFIRKRERNPEHGDLIVPYEKKSIRLNEKRKDWVVGSHYVSSRRWQDSDGHWHSDRQFRNNEIWQVNDFDGELGRVPTT